MNPFKKIADSSDPDYWEKVRLWKQARPTLKRTQMPPYICPECGGDTIHIYRYDRFACEHCVIWSEPPCGCGPEDRCPFEKSPDYPPRAEIQKNKKK